MYIFLQIKCILSLLFYRKYLNVVILTFHNDTSLPRYLIQVDIVAESPSFTILLQYHSFQILYTKCGCKFYIIFTLYSFL